MECCKSLGHSVNRSRTAQPLEKHPQILWVTPPPTTTANWWSHWVGFLSFCKSAVGIFYRASWQGRPILEKNNSRFKWWRRQQENYLIISPKKSHSNSQFSDKESRWELWSSKSWNYIIFSMLTMALVIEQLLVNCRPLWSGQVLDYSGLVPD